jgi:homoserine kinase
LSSACAFAPASIGNVAVGFDILGQSFAGPGDRATVRRVAEPVVRIEAIRGCVSALPIEAERNTAGRALIALREALGLPFGFSIELDKGIAMGSGMGGSAASCVAALVAANALLDRNRSQAGGLSMHLPSKAKRVASGSRHGDNVGPDAVRRTGIAPAHGAPGAASTVPNWLAQRCLVHPHFVLETRHAPEVHSNGGIPNLSRVSSGRAQGLALGARPAAIAERCGMLQRGSCATCLSSRRRAHLITGFASA